MKTKSIVTVIIPVYNCEKYLEECFDSVIKQSIGFDNIEMIIVNDGSTDGSAKIIDKYKKRYSNITVINQKNAGLSAARNAGLDEVKTDFITYFDSDDILPETALEDLVNTAIKNNSDIVIGGMENFTSAGHKPNYTTKYLKDYDRISYKKNIHLLEFVHACGKLYRTSFVAKKRFIVGTKHEDNYYNLSLYLSTDNISMIKKTVYCRRDREGGDKSIMQSLDIGCYDDLLTNYGRALDENKYDKKIISLVIGKVYSYIFRVISTDEVSIAIRKAKLFSKKYTSKGDLSIASKSLLLCKSYIYSCLCAFKKRHRINTEQHKRLVAGATPLVTVIIPTYKRAKYIDRAIDSVLGQSYKNIEIIVVDDNDEKTPDRQYTASVMEKYRNRKNVIYKKHKKNMNGAAARNTGIRIARGEYITFLDDDDYFLHNRIESIVERMEHNKEYGCAYTNVVKVRRGKIYRYLKMPGSGNYKKEMLAQKGILGTGSNMFFRASILKEMGGFDESFQRHQDLEVMVRFFRNYRILKVDNYSVVKDDSDRRNGSNIEKLLKAREHFLSVFRSDIEATGEKEKIYEINYSSLIKMAKKEKDSELIDRAYLSAKKRNVTRLRSRGINGMVRRLYELVRGKMPKRLFLNKEEVASIKKIGNY